MKKVALILLITLLFSVTACTNSSDSSNGKAYTVKFESNGGSAVADVETNKLTEAPVSTKEGQFFCGWYKDADLKTAVSYPFSVKNDMTLYAKWTNSTESIDCPDSSVQFSVDGSYSYEATYLAVPTTIDLEALAEQGYFIKIDATYDVYYEKDFDVPFDIGYFGAPDHHTYIIDPDNNGASNESLPTSTTPTTETISHVVSANQLLNDNYYLKLTTKNTQNIVHFTNVKITFTCQTTK